MTEQTPTPSSDDAVQAGGLPPEAASDAPTADDVAGQDAPAAGTDADGQDAAPVTPDDTDLVAGTATAAETEPADVAADADAAVDDSPADAATTDGAAELETAAEPVAAEPTEPEDPAAADGADEAPAEPVAAPVAPGPRPTPSTVRPVPRPLPRPAAHAPAPAAAPVAPVAPPVDAAEAAHAATFGRVDEDGTVHVREAAGERVVGQFPGASTEEALGLYVRRFLDLQAKVVLFEARLQATDLAVKEIDQTLARLTEELEAPAAVGDLDALRARLDGLRERAAERRAQAEAERAAARAAAVEARTQIVEQAEKIAGTDPGRIQWRPAGEQLRQLLEQWKDAQRSGPRIDRPTEESLWKRFSHARTTFDRERRHFFAELETRNAEAKQVKEDLVAQAEALVDSTDWGATSGVFRDLMAQWKNAGRASRQVDDALWARFRAAQDAFFAARDAANAAVDTEYRANLEVKEALLAEAESLLPVTDLNAAKRALRTLQDRWEAAGRVPRGDLQRVEARLRAVEAAVRDADTAQWRRTNPETRARAEGAAAQLEQAIAGLEADLAAAEAKGDQRRITEARAALDARRAWLEQVQRAAQDARG
ncbi:DUF349 domain-containing protein [Cellulomonas oligotrophica]|uniref:ATPase n=1 Tax=Cellulomonas oligotrophica TaxID=931536 RepID=A0A7Y9JXF7_9CELL|nr:DUF349 domain-containing protein [Cellulomonas oligotrophica]NYD84664.1 hypothetical protein [Cellulomonas oligotrophica]GIG31731.1 hypothetical protein Col01nite_08900 [Cellulomonas oligotrophica]